MWLVVVRIVRFEYRKFSQVHFDYLKEVGRVRLDHHKAYRRILEVCRIYFDYVIADMKLVEVGRISFGYPNLCT